MKILSIFMLLFLVGCGHNVKPEIITEYVRVPVECEEYGKIPPIKPLPVVFVKAKTDDGFIVLGLRGDQYSNLSINSREMVTYMGEQKKAISYYKKCIDDFNSLAQN